MFLCLNHLRTNLAYIFEYQTFLINYKDVFESK